MLLPLIGVGGKLVEMFCQSVRIKLIARCTNCVACTPPYQSSFSPPDRRTTLVISRHESALVEIVSALNSCQFLNPSPAGSSLGLPARMFARTHFRIGAPIF